MSSAQPAQEAVGAGVYLVGRSKGGQHERLFENTVRGAGVRGRKARCGPGRAGAAFEAGARAWQGAEAALACQES